MQWNDIGYLISKTRYNENSLIAEFFTEFHGFSINSGEYSWYFLHVLFHIFLQNLLKFSTVFPIPPSISNASMPQSPRAT